MGAAAVERGEVVAAVPVASVALSPGEAVDPAASAQAGRFEQLGAHEGELIVAAEADSLPRDTAEVKPSAAPDAGSSPRDAGSSPGDAADPEPVAQRCDRSESAGPNGHCYALVTEVLNWRGARRSCQRRGPGWDLASIRTAADNRFLRQLNAGQVWVGGSDAVTEGTWSWVDDRFEFWRGEGTGTALNDAFVNWFGDEPNGSATSDCLRLVVDGRWADFECDEGLGHICEGPSR